MNDLEKQARVPPSVDTAAASTGGDAEDGQPPRSTAAGAAAAAVRGGPINILIVDDEPRNLTVLETVLDDPRYRLIRASSADEALFALVAEEFALLILDIQMPGMTGIELAQMVKGRKKTAQVPIIFLTAYYNEDQDALEGYGIGAVDYLHKPVNPAILRSKVAVFAELHTKSRELVVANGALLAEVTERRRAEDQLRELNETLEQRVAESVAALTRDIAERRRLEGLLREQAATLEDLDRRKDEFLAMLSHELRNPLAPIAHAVHFLGPEENEDPLRQQARTTIDRQIRHLTKLVDDLLDVSRITTGKLQLEREQVAANAIIESAVDTVRPFLAQRRHELEVSLSPGPIWLHADVVRLEQVIVNLLTNAAKYTDEGGQIGLSVQREGDECVWRVRDTGIGITPEFLPHVFGMFTQVDRTLDRSQGGLGIGLALVKTLVELHGGQVEAHSTLGQGCEFVVRVPVMVAPPPEPASRKQPAEPTGRPLRVLIVDDNEDAALMLGMRLKAGGHTVQMVHDGLDALDAAPEFRPDVILLDIGLPGMDGYEVAKSLRRQALLENVVLIATTGYGQDSDRQLSKLAGFDHHLVKPTNFGKLKEILDQCGASSSTAPGAST